MSTTFADDFSTPPLREADFAKATFEALKRAWRRAMPPSDTESTAQLDDTNEYSESSHTAPRFSISATWTLVEDDGLTDLLTDLAALLQRDDYDEDLVKPSVPVFIRAWELLDAA